MEHSPQKGEITVMEDDILKETLNAVSDDDIDPAPDQANVQEDQPSPEDVQPSQQEVLTDPALYTNGEIAYDTTGKSGT